MVLPTMKRGGRPTRFEKKENVANLCLFCSAAKRFVWCCQKRGYQKVDEEALESPRIASKDKQQYLELHNSSMRLPGANASGRTRNQSQFCQWPVS